MTTASAANSSVPSMPLKALLESAAVPSGPAMCTASPPAPAEAMARSESAAGAAAPTIALTTRSLGISSTDASATTQPSRSTVTLRQTS